MIFSIVMLCIGALYLITSKILDSVWDVLYSYNVCDKVVKELGLPEDREIWSEKDKTKAKDLCDVYNKKLEKRKILLNKFRQYFYWNTDNGVCWISWALVVSFSIMLLIGINVDRSDCIKTYKRCELIEQQLEKGFVYETQDTVADMQKKWTENKAFVDNFPFWTFYNKKLTYKTYEKVMSLEVPDFTDTREYITTVNKNVELNTIPEK